MKDLKKNIFYFFFNIEKFFFYNFNETILSLLKLEEKINVVEKDLLNSISIFSKYDKTTNFIFNINLNEFFLIAEFFLAFTALIIITYYSLVLYSEFFKKRTLIQFTTTLVSLLILYFTFILLFNNNELVISKYFSIDFSFLNDSLGWFAKLLTVIFVFICVYLTKSSLTKIKINYNEYELMILYATLGLILLITANDTMTIFLALELQGLSVYILSGIKRKSLYSIDSALKYIFAASLSTGYYLLGSSLLFGLSGLLLLVSFHFFFNEFYKLDVTNNFINFEEFSELNDIFQEMYFYAIETDEETKKVNKNTGIELDNTLNFNQIIVLNEKKFENSNYCTLTIAALSFILISFFFKLAGAPFHLWSLDVYEGSPTSSTIFFSIVTKFSIVIALVRICYYGFYILFKKFLYQYFACISILSSFAGATATLQEKKLKSLLAYSSTNNMGYLLLSLTIGTLNSLKATLFYLIIYLSSTLATWSSLISIQIKKNRYIKKQNKDFGDLILIKKNNVMLTLFFHMAIFSVAGLPPFVGFLTKMNIFLVSIESYIFLLSLITILLSIIACFYYLRLIKITCFEKVLIGKLHQLIQINQSNITNFFGFFLPYQFLKPNFSIFFSYKMIIC